MNSRNNTQDNTCPTCGLCAEKDIIHMGRNVRASIDQRASWRIVEFFYPSYNPFANEFSADYITKPVQDTLLQMARDFATCCEKTTPFEYIYRIHELVGAITSLNIPGVIDAINNLLAVNKPGSPSYDLCRNSIAASTKSRLYLAFLGI